MPGKRPHGNRIRAWGLCASSSAPILHHISSLDGVRAAAESTLPCTLVGSPSSTTNRGKLHGGPFLSGSSEEEAKCGNTSVVLLHIYTFLNSKPSRCRRALGSIRYSGKSDGRTRTCDGHNDCGAGCLCLRSVAHCDHPQPLLLPAVLFARRTDGGLLLGGERGEQAGRHGSPEVRPADRTTLFSRSHSHSSRRVSRTYTRSPAARTWWFLMRLFWLCLCGTEECCFAAAVVNKQ